MNDDKFIDHFSHPRDLSRFQANPLEHDAPKLTDFGDNIMLQIIDFDHVYDFGLIQSKIIVI
jgi:hypothetical protein